MLNLEQQHVFGWLNDTLGLPVFADLYKCAVHMLSNESPGYVTVAAHAGREIMNSLPNVISGTTRTQVQYAQLVDEIQNDWKNETKNKNVDGSLEAENGRFIPTKTCEKIDKLISEHEEGRNRGEDTRDLFFRLFLDYTHKNIPSNLLSDWTSAKNWFMKHTHLRGENFPNDISLEVRQHFGMLDSLLQVAATSAHQRLRNADEILEETNR